MYMLGLISSCTGPFLQTYPKMALLPPIRVQISLYGNKLRQVEGDTPSPKRGSLLYCKSESELIQMIRMGKSIRHKCVKVLQQRPVGTYKQILLLMTLSATSSPDSLAILRVMRDKRLNPGNTNP